jgi:cytoskeletal protein RodZ
LGRSNGKIAEAVKDTLLAAHRKQREHQPPDELNAAFVEALTSRACELGIENEMNAAFVAQLLPLSVWEWEALRAFLSAKQTAEREHQEQQAAEDALARQQAALNASLGRR